MARAVAAYASATGESRARQFEADYRYIQTLHLQALRADEYAIAEWDSLIRPALTQLAAYHESGIKTETIVSIFQGLANIGLLSVLVAKD